MAFYRFYIDFRIGWCIVNNFLEVCSTKKFLLICVIFFLLIGAYTLMKEFQSSVFMTMVGVEYIPIAKALSFVIVIPVVFFYSYCVDKYTNRLLLGYSLLFVGLIGVIFTVICGHETIGLYNKSKGTLRVTGWLFY